MKDALAIGLALLCGLVLASYDTRTDDTAIELGLLLIASIILTLLAPKRWWAIALLVGSFIPLVELATSQAAGTRVPPGVVAVIVTFIGALIGLAIARASRSMASA